jgi:hypothetical protein
MIVPNQVMLINAVKPKYQEEYYIKPSMKRQISTHSAVESEDDYDMKEAFIHKVCSACGDNKSFDNYSANQWNNKGLGARCKQCVNNNYWGDDEDTFQFFDESDKKCIVCGNEGRQGPYYDVDGNEHYYCWIHCITDDFGNCDPNP